MNSIPVIELDGAGILPAHAINALAESGIINAHEPFDADQVQPASLDLRLGKRAFRVRAIMLSSPWWCCQGL